MTWGQPSIEGFEVDCDLHGADLLPLMVPGDGTPIDRMSAAGQPLRLRVAGRLKASAHKPRGLPLSSAYFAAQAAVAGMCNSSIGLPPTEVPVSCC